MSSSVLLPGTELNRKSEKEPNSKVFILNPLFQDHMVLQSGQSITVYGMAGSGEEIETAFRGWKKNIKADKSGKWKFILPPTEPGGPYDLLITGKNGGQFALRDIFFGDVWVCAGQSNMRFTLEDAGNSAGFINSAENNLLRLFNYKGIANPDATVWDSIVLRRTSLFDFFEGQWEISDPEASRNFSAIGYFFGRRLSMELDIPVGIIELAVGGAPAEAFIDKEMIINDPEIKELATNWRKNPLIMGWCRERADLNLRGAVDPGQRHPFEPGFIFKAGIANISELPVSGVIWYQGESNAENPVLHEKLFPALVESWRKAWGDKHLPFYFAQLSSIDRQGWPEFRDSQRRLVSIIPNSGMVVTSDLGDSLNVHPVKKYEVGERFAALALKDYYKKDAFEVSPVIKKVSVLNNIVTIDFVCNGSLQTSDGKPVREIETEDNEHHFHKSEAKIEGKSLKILCNVSQPVAVRYGWVPFSRGNLVSEQKLPVSTFRVSIK